MNTRNTKHTPGPWGAELSETANGAPDTARIQSNGVGVAITDHANARLIAAAPEMLETLRHVAELLADCPTMLKQDSETRGTLQRLKALIARIEGES